MDESGDILLSEMRQMTISLWDVRKKQTNQPTSETKNGNHGQGVGRNGEK